MTEHAVQHPAVSRFPLIDAVKAIASQLIVLHHLAFYGPMSDYAQEISPELISWLSQHARIAVQAFLVMGGFLAAQALAKEGRLVDKPIVAVPTSVGYGASFGGIAALLAMLNSCAPGVTVVNIDNGFGAAYATSTINRLG